MIPAQPGPAGALNSPLCLQVPSAALALFTTTQRRQQAGEQGIFSILQAFIGVILSLDTASEHWGGIKFISSFSDSPDMGLGEAGSSGCPWGGAHTSGPMC